MIEGQIILNVEPDSVLRIAKLSWKIENGIKYDVYLKLRNKNGKIIIMTYYIKCNVLKVTQKNLTHIMG